VRGMGARGGGTRLRSPTKSATIYRGSSIRTQQQVIHADGQERPGQGSREWQVKSPIKEGHAQPHGTAVARAVRQPWEHLK
jgi:hypothetical protein